MNMQDKYHFECHDCGATYPGGGVIYLCPSCRASCNPDEPPRGVLKTIYRYAELSRSGDPKSRFEKLLAAGFLQLLPVDRLASMPPLKTGRTPMYRYRGIPGGKYGENEPSGHAGFLCYLKDDSQNPTFSFKDRASALVSAWASEHGISRIVAASTGNAGSSLAGICASQGQQAVVVVPATAPVAKLTQVLMYGATLIPVEGTYDDAFGLSIALSEQFGWYNRNTGYNPLTIEGKKTVAFEIFRDLGHRIPDRIFVPTGDGVILSGVYKGFEDLLMSGIIEQMPCIVAVQAEGSPNLARNLHSANFEVTPSDTIADSISVDVPRNFHMAAGFIKKYAGTCITVSDDEIRAASVRLASSTGIFTEPASAAAFAGLVKYHELNEIGENTCNVVMLTGSGLKDPGACRSLLAMPDPVRPEIAAVERFLKHQRKEL